MLHVIEVAEAAGPRRQEGAEVVGLLAAVGAALEYLPGLAAPVFDIIDPAEG